MREAITLGYKPGVKEPEIILGPTTPIVEHTVFAREKAVDPDNPYELIEVWTSDGGVSKTVKNRNAKPEPETGDEPKRRGRPPKTLP